MHSQQHGPIHEHAEGGIHRFISKQFLGSTNDNDVCMCLDEVDASKIRCCIPFAQHPAAFAWIVLTNVAGGCYGSGDQVLLAEWEANGG